MTVQERDVAELRTSIDDLKKRLDEVAKKHDDLLQRFHADQLASTKTRTDLETALMDADRNRVTSPMIVGWVITAVGLVVSVAIALSRKT